MSTTPKISLPLYFIAIVPPEPIAAEITAIKEEMAITYRTKAALRSPPHITLHMPFRLEDKKLPELQEFLEGFARSLLPFEIYLKNFGAFPPRVIFVGMEANEKLQQLQHLLLRGMRRALNIFNGDYKQKAFHPHMTVAFRDLKPANFREAWEVYRYKTLSFDFTLKALWLLKHNGQKWETFESFQLGDTII